MELYFSTNFSRLSNYLDDIFEDKQEEILGARLASPATKKVIDKIKPIGAHSNFKNGVPVIVSQLYEEHELGHAISDQIDYFYSCICSSDIFTIDL